MKKIDFSKENLKIKTNKIKKFLKKHYITFFKNSPLLLAFILTTLINTILLRAITVHNIFNIKPILVDLGFLFIVSAFYFNIKKNKNKIIYLMIWSIFTAILCTIHAIYYTYYSSFASISLLATSTFVVDVGDAVVENVIKIEDFIFFISPIFLYYIYTRLVKKEKIKENIKINKVDKKFSFTNMTVTGIIILTFSCLIMTKTDWSRFTKMWNRESVVSSFGLYVYQVNDIVQSLEPKINNLFGHDKALKTFTEFYEENNYTKQKNEYTDIFKGKNVIVIHAESIQTIAMELSFNGEEVTPNLNKLAKEGIFFKNFYSQVGVGTSSDAEFTFSTSLMPSSSGTVFVNYFDRKYVSIQNLLKEQNYYTFSMHGNTADFWNRATMHKNLGYDKFYSKTSFDINETIGLGISDKSFFNQVIPILKEIKETEDRPFYGTLITLTNHTPFSDLELMDEYETTMTIEIDGEEVTRDYINGTTLGNYLRSTHYADQAIGEFINNLDKEGLLEDTVIVIYGDHDARLSQKDYNILYNYDAYTDELLESDDEGYIDYNQYEYKLDKNVPFIIWTKDKKFNQEITTPTGMIDALPTLGNMLGIHSEYQIGTDIMNITDEDNTVVFSDGSYLTDKIYYNNQNGEIYSINGKAVDETYIDERAEYANKIIEVSNNIITYDLIKEKESQK